MTDYIDLAIKHGGFTSLDRVYLTRCLAGLTKEQKLVFITPPPSVINAYFAESYQKKSPAAAMAYLLEITRAFDLWMEQPSFEEERPFIRLNLSGKSYGLCLENEGLARIFPEVVEEVNSSLLFEIAQIFPDHLVFEREGKIYLTEAPAELITERQVLTDLTDLVRLEDGRQKLEGYNQEELAGLAQNYAGRPHYRSQNRRAMIYMI